MENERQIENVDNWDPSIGELIAAVEDSSHPHHNEAIERNKHLAEQMVPYSEALKKYQEKTYKQISDTVNQSLLQLKVKSINKLTTNPNSSTSFLASPIQNLQKDLEEIEIAQQQILDQAAKDKAKNEQREKIRDNLLQALVAQVTESNRKQSELIIKQDKLIKIQQKSSKSSSFIGCATLFIAFLTLVVAIAPLIPAYFH